MLTQKLQSSDNETNGKKKIPILGARLYKQAKPLGEAGSILHISLQGGRHSSLMVNRVRSVCLLVCSFIRELLSLSVTLCKVVIVSDSVAQLLPVWLHDYLVLKQKSDGNGG